MNCPCGRNGPYSECCEPLLAGRTRAQDPESLMRSRYVAFVKRNVDYLIETTDPQTVLEFDREATREWAEKSEFLRLEVLQAGREANKGFVEFKAYFRTGDGPEQIHHEYSRFRRQGGIWYFRDGKIRPPER